MDILVLFSCFGFVWILSSRLPMYPRLAWNPKSSCLRLLNAGTINLSHHAFMLVWRQHRMSFQECFCKGRQDRAVCAVCPSMALQPQGLCTCCSLQHTLPAPGTHRAVYLPAPFHFLTATPPFPDRRLPRGCNKVRKRSSVGRVHV